jgi:hypothetical protein
MQIFFFTRPFWELLSHFVQLFEILYPDSSLILLLFSILRLYILLSNCFSAHFLTANFMISIVATRYDHFQSVNLKAECQLQLSAVYTYVIYPTAFSSKVVQLFRGTLFCCEW